ncbi:type I inositol polyphosphate 5-phosphatase 4 isoform X1 [Populus trichocarpa]|uniref:type I inositol polyphosphate 5-phosphatase 4 isoform X1 n=1 Tax=Populus trichocarpa TaxID=3694 RepID=UPI000D18A67C|nr:type I inositol polyphosphate 5-phosphatase 4 isoform X1 [Populus trichocarpa]XP_024456705.1 type I inositol polyphosphate 5-phosphatase 4 isoform X1 [Populus trichocarpa]XP_024456706.1 type I inositol polyphosphate 5-phosphatase 4 isoform X1 [Populus trichocarpa]XP_024456707.1 type I inositol polyphosphate 5-phosphatase 4 isoform X1 [Populus trichocarpa]XP_024456709.1 type I inositol polyphosphate 5-phosphatase 4 isoform X1 [Populus trichocarpa]|eukprot:XP_024456703.1 type I inositol polyphosphate 5-phosphatase 4 isoform X1 [Populus trichocarpa]
MRTRRRASFHGLRHWSRSGSISRAKLRNFKQMMSFTEVAVKSGITTSQREKHAPSRKAKQVQYQTPPSIETSYRRHSGGVQRGKIDLDAAQVTDVNNYRIFVATWNVAGKSPPSHLNLEDWLHTSPPADIYVLGFQEIVPLNAGNVLGTEDNGPGKKWLALIRKTLNSLPGTSWGYHTPSPVSDPIVELDADFEGSTRQKASSFFHRRSFQSLSRSMRMDGDMVIPQPKLDRRFSVCDRVIFGNRPSDYDPNYQWGSSDDENGPGDSPLATQHSPIDYSGSLSMEDRDRQTGQSRYCLVACKQMVGVFLTVWVKSDLRDDVRNLKVSCVGRGLMGYLGNKGSISISMALHQTSFCFICSHLTSGQKEGDELRRNSDVMEILRKTRFPRVHSRGDKNSPQTILEHDRIIWLGDLNYRIALSYRAVKTLVEMQNWRALLENDQLRIEQGRGRVFDGWNEGKIYFPPTYKYSNNSDRYAGDDRHPKEKRRTPAWCDRILWYGRGLTQLSYVRGESRFSDHRPVCGVFLAEVESINRSRIKKSMSCSNSRIEVEELLPHLHGYTEFNFF